MIPQGFMMSKLPTGFGAAEKTAGPMGPAGGSVSGKSFSSVLGKVSDMGKMPGEAAKSVVGKVGGEIANLQAGDGVDLAGKLNKILGKMGITTGGKAVGEDFLNELSQLLVDLGFDKGEVSALMKKLNLSSEAGEVKLTDLLAGLEELGDTLIPGGDDEEEMMAVSALPFLESILSSYGLTPEQTKGVLDGATGKSGISVPRLVAGLKEVQESSHPDDRQIASGRASETDPGFSRQLASLLEQIGVKGENENGEPLSFDDFLVELGKMTRNKTDVAGTGAGAITGTSAGTGSAAAEGLKQIIAELSSGKTEGASADTATQMKGAERKEINLKAKDGKAKNVSDLKAANTVGEKAAPLEETLPGEKEILKGIRGSAEENVRAGIEADTAGEAPEVAPKTSGTPAAGDAVVGLSEGKASESRAAEVIARPPAEKRGLPAYVMNQVSKQLVRSSADGESEVQIHIRPPRLGRLQMTIDNSEGGFKVTIIAEHQAARDMLTAHSGELKAALAEQGMRVDSLDVSLSRDFDQTLADMRRDQGQGRRGGRGNGASGGGMDGDDLEALGVERGARLDRGDYDLVA